MTTKKLKRQEDVKFISPGHEGGSYPVAIRETPLGIALRAGGVKVYRLLDGN